MTGLWWCQRSAGLCCNLLPQAVQKPLGRHRPVQVMAALGSNSERWGIFQVSLEFERRGSGSGSEGGAA